MRKESLIKNILNEAAANGVELEYNPENFEGSITIVSPDNGAFVE